MSQNTKKYMNVPATVAVSVVVPIYNSIDTIATCIASIQQQQLTDIEIILVDDGSTDGSGRICDEFAIKDARINVIHQPNSGRTMARKRGTQFAHGVWIAYVDSDDSLPATALWDLYQQVNDETDIVFGNGGSIALEHRTRIPIQDFRHLTVRSEGTIGVPWGSLYRRIVLSDNLFDIPREIINGEDYLFWVRLVFQTQKAVHVVYKAVYNKGADHTSNTFVWTADYCQRLHQLRVESIPAEMYDEFADDVICDGLVNLFATAVCQSRKVWGSSHFYLQLMHEIKERRYRMGWKKQLFLQIPSLRLRRLIAKVFKKIK